MIAWLGACAGQRQSSDPGVSDTFDDNDVSWDQFRADPPVTWAQFRASVAREQSEPYRFIVDGDIPLASEDELRAHYDAWLRQEYAATLGGEALTVYNVLGADVIWPSPQRGDLTYCVSDSFGAQKPTLVAALDRATRSWSDLVAVGFRYVPGEDARCTSSNTSVVFDVNPVTADYFAASFFPNYARSIRELLVTAGAFTTTEGGRDLEGIMRHETGHILGFRHEHIHIACTEETTADSRLVTSYDVNSVMHYPQCRPSGTGGYRQTVLDYAGAVSLYGSRPSALVAGSSLAGGQAIVSPDGQNRAVMQSDGNLVLLQGGIAAWSAGTAGSGATRLAMQTDGNLVLYTAANAPKWATGTNGSGADSLRVQNDGNLVVYAGSRAVWASNTRRVVGSAATAPATLGGNARLESPDGRFEAVMQTDGNFVVYFGSQALFATGTNGSGADHFAVQSDGNLVVYDAANRPKWASGTNGRGGSRLAMQNDGNLVLYTASNAAVWASNTGGH